MGQNQSNSKITNLKIISFNTCPKKVQLCKVCQRMYVDVELKDIFEIHHVCMGCIYNELK